MTVILDDHLLRDWLSRRQDDLSAAIANEPVATTNLWYARLCKAAARATEGAVLHAWSVAERRALAAGLIALPAEVMVVPMRDVAWPMGQLVADHRGLSTLGAEAVASAAVLGARVLVSSRDDGPGIRRCCEELAIPYESLER